MIEQGRVYSTPNELHLPDTDGGYSHSDQIIQSSTQKPYQPVGVVPGLFNMEEGQQNMCSNSQNQSKLGLLRRPCLIIANGIKWLPVLFITGVISWSYYAFIVELCIFTVVSLGEKVFYIVMYHIILVLFVWSYYKTIFAPIPKTDSSWKLSTAMLERLSSAKSEEDWKNLLELFVIEMELPVVQRSIQGAIRYCDKCQAVKPDRSHHCSVCQDCILKMDHHCPWVNNCVAFNNYKFSILFLGYALSYCVFLAACTLQYFLMFWTDKLDNRGAGKFHILFLFFVSIMFCISVSSLFWYHIYLVLNNRSTLEQFRAPYFNDLSGVRSNGASVGPRADEQGWSLGKMNNFQEVFGYNKLLWLLPIHTAVGDGITFPTRITTADTPSYHSTDNYRNSAYRAQTNLGVASNNSGTNINSEDNSCTINMISETHDQDGNTILPTATSDYSLMTNHAVGAHSSAAISPASSFDTCVQQKINSSHSREVMQPTQVVLEANNKVSVIKVG